MPKEHVAVLIDIRSAENVGALFRTADAAGLSKLYLVGTTPQPIDRFGRARKDIAKAALGAEKTIAWEAYAKPNAIIKKLKVLGFMIVAIEQSPHSTDYKKIKSGAKMAFLVGNEVKGISSTVLKECDSVAEISQRGKKESLNVATAFGIAVFRILNI